MKKNAWLFILVTLVIISLRNINIFKIPIMIVLGISLIFMVIFILVLIKIKSFKNKYFKLFFLNLILMCCTLTIILVIDKIYPYLFINLGLIIGILMIGQLISLIVIGLLAINKGNRF